MIYLSIFFFVTEICDFHIILIKCIACKLLWVKVSAKWINIKYLLKCKFKGKIFDIHFGHIVRTYCNAYFAPVHKSICEAYFPRCYDIQQELRNPLTRFSCKCVTYCRICSPVLSCKSLLEVPTLCFPQFVYENVFLEPLHQDSWLQSGLLIISAKSDLIKHLIAPLGTMFDIFHAFLF